MKAKEIRETFLRFFEERGHTRVPSAPVVLQDDPTLYFTNAGMNQFKDVFLGLGQREYTRAVNTQKCIRVSGKHNDLEEVGISPRHQTFFEMLGNWSFGDYFKKEAIEWAWALLTEVWSLEKERLWATVFEGDGVVEPDEEAEKLWLECTDIPAERIVRLPAKDNFWEMGQTGPCGPCSEIHYYHGELSKQSRKKFLEGSEAYKEFWNLVFIQYNRDEAGKLHPLPAKHVDTGMGLERLCTLLQGVETNYDTDLFQTLIGRIAELSGTEYAGDRILPMRVIADHVRALSFAIADGALPSNEGRGYVLRRILRRASRYGRQLDQHEPFMYRLVETVGELMGEVFPEVVEKKDHVSLVIRAEEEGFGKTLDRGLEIFARLAEKGQISGGDAFQLYDTYGFPLDLTQLMARERAVPVVGLEEFDRALEGQRQRARQATRGRFSAAEGVGDALEGRHSRFVGYEELEVEVELVHAEKGKDGRVRLFLDRTPFYAESGGQVGDQGRIEGRDFAVEVEDTQKARGGIAHLGRLVQGELEAVRGRAWARVNQAARQAASRNHTATHLLHEALRRTLGEHVAQMGSLVAPERLRFDFSHFAAPGPEQMEEVEGLVNEQIRANLEVAAFQEELDKAKKLGARALFGEKYEKQVRVVRIGQFSLELCGGTHVRSTGEIGSFALVGEGGIAAGTRRAEALSGAGAEQKARQERRLLARLSGLLNVPAQELPARVEGMLGRQRELERSLHELRRREADLEANRFADRAQLVEGVRVVARRAQVEDMPALRILADGLREKLGSGVGVLGTELEGKVSFIAVVTDDLIQGRGLKAGEIVRGVAQLAGGSGGGKAHLAQAGARDPDKLEEALAAVPEIVRQQLSR
jgi:alanyl-tRNA synthetase